MKQIVGASPSGGGVAQRRGHEGLADERWSHTPEDAGSSPAPASQSRFARRISTRSSIGTPRLPPTLNSVTSRNRATNAR